MRPERDDRERVEHLVEAEPARARVRPAEPVDDAAGGAVLAFVVAGGLLYTVGGLVYGIRRPDPSPRWFGFHEVFHALTVLAFASHCAGLALAVTAS